MSTSNAYLAEEYESFVLGIRATYAAAALVCFEHLITFKYEVEFLWKRKWSASTWIFVFNRYLLLADVIYQAAPAVPQVCNNAPVMNALAVLFAGEVIELPTHVFSILRTFALLQGYAWRRPVAWILVAISLALIVIGPYGQSTEVWMYVDDPILGSSCFQTGYSAPLSLISRLGKAASIISVSSGSFALGVVLWKTARQVRQASILRLGTTLSEVLFRYGSLLFLVILLQDLYAMIQTLNNSVFSPSFTFAATPFLNILNLVLLSRFIINLRQVDAPGSGTSANRSLSRFSVPNFRVPTMDDVVGNLGEPLDFGEHRFDGEDDDAKDGGADTDADAELQDAAGASMASGAADPEAASSSGSGSANGDVLDIDDANLGLRLGSITLV